MKNDKEEKPRIVEVVEYLNKDFDLRYNVLKGYPEYCVRGESEYKHADQMFINTQVVELKCRGIKTSYQEVDQVLNSAIVDKYDPFEQYFNSLPQWDESKSSEIERLADTVETNDQEYFKLCLKRWILALVASATNAETVNQQMIVLSGKQGLGKSTWISNLVPKSLEKYHYSGAVNPNNKDTYIHLAESLIINLDELTNMNKKQASSFKEIITQGTINIRKPFGRSSQKLTRRASFIGSINDSEFLYDLTGSRRFLCFEVNNIKYQNDINIDSVYSEAMHLLNRGDKFYFDKEDIQLIEKKNERFRVKNPMEIKLLDQFSPKDLGVKLKSSSLNLPDVKNLRPTDVYKYLYEKEPTGGEVSYLGKLLNKHKFKFKFIKGNKHYELYGIPKVEE